MSSHEDEGISIRLGRKAPYTYLGDWVALSNSTVQAKALYWFLSMHINTQRGNTVVWPSRSRMATAIGLKHARSVDRYIRELEALGAINKERKRSTEGDWANNSYLIHQTPPPGYAQPVELLDWYDTQKPPNSAPVPSSQKNQTKRISAAHGVVTSRSLPSHSEVTTVVTHRSHELKEEKLKKTSPLTPQADKAASTAKTATKEGEGNLRDIKKQHPAATAFVAALPTGTKAPGAKWRKRLITEVARLLDAGVDPEQLRRTLLTDMGSAQHWFATFTTRAADLEPSQLKPPAHKPSKKRLQIVTETTETPLAPEERKTHLEAVRAQIRRPRVSIEDRAALASRQ